MKYLYILVCICMLASCSSDNPITPQKDLPTSFTQIGLWDSVWNTGTSESHYINFKEVFDCNLKDSAKLRISFDYTKFSYGFDCTFILQTYLNYMPLERSFTMYHSIPDTLTFVEGHIDTTIIVNSLLNIDSARISTELYTYRIQSSPDTLMYLTMKNLSIKAVN